MRNLKQKIDDMGIKDKTALACLFNCLAGLMFIQFSRMGVPFSSFFIVFFGILAGALWWQWKTMSDGIPTRADIRRENEGKR